VAELTDADRERRRGGLGGSDAPVVFGLKGSRFALYADKVWGTTDKGSPYAQRGHDLEPLIGEKVARRHGITDLTIGGWVDHPDHGWMFANLDFTANDGGVLIECKARDLTWNGAGWGPDGDPEGVPLDIEFQVRHQLIVTGAELAIVGVLFVDVWEFRTYEIKPERDLAERLVAGLRRFWHDHVLARIPPSVDDGPKAWDAMRTTPAAPKTKDLPPDTLSKLLAPMDTARTLRLLNEKAEKGWKAEVAALMGDAEIGLIDGVPAVEFKAPPSGGARQLKITNLYHKENLHGIKN